MRTLEDVRSCSSGFWKCYQEMDNADVLVLHGVCGRRGESGLKCAEFVCMPRGGSPGYSASSVTWCDGRTAASGLVGPGRLHDELRC